MATISTQRDEESIKSLKSLIESTYLDGQCYELAVALHRGLDWPIVGILEDTVVRHALVRMPSGHLWDARGEVTGARIGEPFGLREPLFQTFPNEPRFLNAVRPVHELAIERARRLAENLWPDELPWINSRKKRALRFATAFEELCREYGCYVRAPYPGGRPLLVEHDSGDTVSYALQITDDGMTYAIDRVLG